MDRRLSRWSSIISSDEPYDDMKRNSLCVFHLFLYNKNATDKERKTALALCGRSVCERAEHEHPAAPLNLK